MSELPISLNKSLTLIQSPVPFCAVCRGEEKKRVLDLLLLALGETLSCSQNKNELSDIKGMYILFEGGVSLYGLG